MYGMQGWTVVKCRQSAWLYPLKTLLSCMDLPAQASSSHTCLAWLGLASIVLLCTFANEAVLLDANKVTSMNGTATHII